MPTGALRAAVVRHGRALPPLPVLSLTKEGVKGKALLPKAALPTSRPRILGGVDEEAQGRVARRP
ncbi:hypothetical protein A3J91_03630 [Candidatus Peribacteria bacterium RIFOXYC2_FULL_58_10]|nr:MAG: hypothetical protein A3J91_03630 [Candidatus Peribacteria bacterium RIFOXYC2_FULL_58_10]OGJ85269.1 MAG: hypothetical protein A2529_02285 [Candidatus Peribacteria bacterium RIFOXYD2_FULL_58_15]HAS33965.1 hypothetical protein [Candidatus Peribacteria bacterium]